jgi:hypothetical protein
MLLPPTVPPYGASTGLAELHTATPTVILELGRELR